MQIFKTIIFLALISQIISCQNTEKNIATVLPKKHAIIYIQPFSDINAKDVAVVLKEIQKIYSPVYLMPTKPIPQIAYTKLRNRYRADTLLRIIQKATPSNCKTLALTNKDISTTKNKIADFGVMGLGYTPGRACVVSTFRLHKRYMLDQLYKVAIHELGHTFGLPHCPNKSCYMRDAEGGNPLQDEVTFCENCKKVLMAEGW